MTLHDLTALNTLALPASAPALFRYRSPEQLPELAEYASRHSDVFILGGGSNVVLPATVSSAVIQVESRGIHVIDEPGDFRVVEAAAGESWHGFVSHCVGQGWGGLENLALIPGTVGAAPVQNIGAYGVELDQRLHSVVAWDLKHARLVEFAPEDCDFSYRSSMFKHAEPGRWLIVKVRFRLPAVWQAVLRYPDLQRHPGLSALSADISPRDVFDAVCEIRRQKLPDPAVLPNAGSFFKNPVVSQDAYCALQGKWPDLVAYAQPDGTWKLAAGWLIERAGWKGRRLGPVGMHERQALVLVNHGGASADDVTRLAQAVKNDVKSRFDVDLEQEPVPVK